MIHVRKDYSNPVRTSEDKLHQFFDEFWPSGFVFVVWLQKYSISFALFHPKSYSASFLSNSIAAPVYLQWFNSTFSNTLKMSIDFVWILDQNLRSFAGARCTALIPTDRLLAANTTELSI